MKKLKSFILSKSQSLVSILVLVLIFFIPLYPKFPSIEIPNTYVRIRLEDFLVAFTYLISLPLIWENRKKFLKNHIFQAVIIYWLVGFISLISAIFVTRLIYPHIVLLHFLRRIEYMGLFFIGFLAVRQKKDLPPITIGFALMLLLITIYGLGQKFFNFPVVSTMNAEFSKGTLLNLNRWTRISATFGGHYDLAAFLSLLMPIILMTFFIVNKKKKIGAIIIFIFAYYLLILTASRTSFAAYLGAILFLLLFLNKKWWIVPVIGLSLIGSAFSQDINQRFNATIKYDLPRLTNTINYKLSRIWPERKYQPKETAVAMTTPAPKEEINSSKTTVFKTTNLISLTIPSPTPTERPHTQKEDTELGVQRSGGIRFGVEWPRAWRHFKKNPLLGTGYSSLGLATDNDYLRALGETGLLGFLAFLNIFIQLAIFFFKKNQSHLIKYQQYLIAGIVCATLAMLANGIFIDVFEASKVAFIYWLILGISLKAITLEKHNALEKN